MVHEMNIPVTSPCMSVCALDEDDICIGCFRTAEEISNWSVMSDKERSQVLSDITQRGIAKRSYFGSFQ